MFVKSLHLPMALGLVLLLAHTASLIAETPVPSIRASFAESSANLPDELPQLPEPWEYLGCVFDSAHDAGVDQTNFFCDRLEIYSSCPGLELINTGHHIGTHVAIQYQQDGVWDWRPALYPDKQSIPELDFFSACYFTADPEVPGAYFLTYQRSGPNGTHVLFYITPRQVSDPGQQPYDANVLLTGRDDGPQPGDPICYGGMWSLPVPFSFGEQPRLLALVNGYREEEGPGFCYSTHALVHELDTGETWGSIPCNRYQFIWLESGSIWVPLRWNAIDILGDPIPDEVSSTNAAAEIFTVDQSMYLLVTGGVTKKSDNWENETSRGFITLYRFLDDPPPEPHMAYRVELVQEIVDPVDALPGSPAMIGGFIPSFMEPIRLTGEIEEVPSFLCCMTRRPPGDPDRWVHDYDRELQPVPGGFVIIRGQMADLGPEFELQPPYPGDADFLCGHPAVAMPGDSYDNVVFKTFWDDRNLVFQIPNQNGSFHLDEAQVLFDQDRVISNQDWKVYFFQACFIGVFPTAGRDPSLDLVLPLSHQDLSDSTHQCHTFIVWEDVPSSVGNPHDDDLTGNTHLLGYPNPFGRNSTFRFSLREPGSVRLTVYDLRGVKIRTITDEFPAGSRHSLAWNSRDDTGREIPSGVYFFRLEADGVSTGKMVRISR